MIDETFLFRGAFLESGLKAVLRFDSRYEIHERFILDDTVVLSEVGSATPVVAVVGAPDPDLDRALRGAGGVRVTRCRAETIPDDVALIVAVGEPVPVRPGVPCVWIAPRSGIGPFHPGAVRERPAITDVTSGVSLLAGIDLRAIQWRRVRSCTIDPMGANSVRVFAATEAGPLLARWDASDGAPRYLCAVETAWAGEESASDWSRLPAFPVFWAALLGEVLGERESGGRGRRIVALRVGAPVLVRNGMSAESVQAQIAANEKAGQVVTVRRVGGAWEWTPWRVGPFEPEPGVVLHANLLDARATRRDWKKGSLTGSPIPGTPRSGRADPRERPLSPWALGIALAAFLAAWCVESR